MNATQVLKSISHYGENIFIQQPGRGWCIIGASFADGDIVTVTKRDGSTSQVEVRDVKRGTMAGVSYCITDRYANITPRRESRPAEGWTCYSCGTTVRHGHDCTACGTSEHDQD